MREHTLLENLCSEECHGLEKRVYGLSWKLLASVDQNSCQKTFATKLKSELVTIVRQSKFTEEMQWRGTPYKCPTRRRLICGRVQVSALENACKYLCSNDEVPRPGQVTMLRTLHTAVVTRAGGFFYLCWMIARTKRRIFKCSMPRSGVSSLQKLE